MKIVNIIQRYPPAIGGSETWCQQVCRFLVKQGHQVRVLTLDVNEEAQYYRSPLESERTLAFGKLALDGGVIIRRYKRSLPIHAFHHLIYGVLFDRLFKTYFYGPHSGEMYARMWREIKAADLVFLHTAPYPHNFIAFIFAKLFRKRVVFAPHFHPAHPHYERPSNYWLLKRCDAVITVSSFEKEYLKAKGVANEKLFVTGNAIHVEDYLAPDLDAFKTRIKRDFGLQPEDKVVCFIGRKIPEKGVDHLISAAKNLIADMPLKVFLLGPNSDWFREIWAGLSTDEKKRIFDLNVVSHADKVNFLHLSDLLVLPSRYEAFGIVFLEAWTCGVPVMGTTEGAMPSVIGNEGFVCKFGDVKDLTARLRAALSDSKRLMEMGKRGKAKVLHNFTWQVIGEKAKQAVERAYGRKKILICSNSYPPKFIGGAELIAHNQAKILNKRGHEVAVFAGVADQKATRYSLEETVFEGIPVRRVCLRHRDYNADFANLCHKEVEEQFIRILDDFSPDIVHFHNIIGLSAGLPEIARRRKLKTVLTLHDYWAICHKNTILKTDGKPCMDFKACEACPSHISDDNWESLQLRMRCDYISLQLQNMHTVISPSQYLARIYDEVGIFRNKVKVIPNGVDVDRFRMVQKKSNPKEVRFSFIGHLGPHKGVRTIIEALPLVRGRRRFRLNIVGEGWQQPELERTARKVGMQNRVAFWGKVDNRNIEKVYEKTDVLILPSIWPENQPVSITEAMACGLPVIAARVGGIPELVDDDKTGYLFESGNVEDLAGKMSEFLADASKIAQFGKNGFKKIAAYTFENQVDRIVECYTSLNHGAGGQNDKNVIACIGRQIQPECVAGFDRFVKNNKNGCKLVSCEWLDDVGLEHSRLLWVLDKNVNPKSILVGLRNELPLLVPDGHATLKALCQSEKCGLSYRTDPIELEALLKFFFENETARESMGTNALRAFYTYGIC